MEKFNPASGIDDSLPPPYSSLIQPQCHQHVLRPLVPPTTSYQMPIPMSHAIYSRPKTRSDGRDKPTLKFGSRDAYAVPFSRDSEVPVMTVIESAAHDETTDVYLQRRSSMTISRKVSIIAVILLVCGFWAVMSINLYSKHRTS